MSRVTYTSASQTYAYSTPGYYVQNDAWGAGSLVNGVDYSISATFDPASLQSGASFSWVFPQDVGGVYAYPHIDFEPQAAGISTTQTGNIANLSASYNASLTNSAESTLAFDLWFNSQPNGSWTTTSAELLIEVHSTSAGKPNEPFVLSGSGFTGATVYASNSSGAGANWKFVDVKLPADMMSGTLSISDIIKGLILDGLLTGQEYLTSAQFGSEVHGGTGGLQIDSLGYNWTANPTLTGTAGDDTFSIANSGGNNVVGNGGTDTVVYAGSYSSYQIKSAGSEILVTNDNNVSTLDELQGIAFIKFSDGVYNIQTGNFVANTPIPAAPQIVSFSPDTNVVGDGITNADQVALAGTAAAGSTVEVFDGATQIGTATANASGAWTFATATLADGNHAFTTKAMDAAGNVSAASNVLSVTIDTYAPVVSESLARDTGSSSTDKVTSNPTLTGSGDANAVVTLKEGATILGTTTADAAGHWTFAATGLVDGTHTILASETDAAANTGTASTNFTLDTHVPVPVITNEVLSQNRVTLSGTVAEANDTISVYDGSTLIGATKSDSNGLWSLNAKVSGSVHTFTASATDAAGNVGYGSNDAILGSSKGDTLTGTAGNDIIIGNGGNDRIVGGGGADIVFAGSGKDAFIFKAISDSTPTSHDTIQNFNHLNDVIDFNNIAGLGAVGSVPAFQGQLAGSGNLTLNAHSIAYVEMAGNTEILVNTTNSAETVTALDAHAVNMEIVLTGTHLGLASANFHLI